MIKKELGQLAKEDAEECYKIAKTSDYAIKSYTNPTPLDKEDNWEEKLTLNKLKAKFQKMGRYLVPQCVK